MESGLTKINDIDEVLILTKDPASIVNSDIARTNEENKCDTMDSTNDNENLSWLEEFTSALGSVVGNANYELFEYLLSTYQKKLSKDFYNWQLLQPPKFAKLKNHIRNTLTFFHFCWRNIKERVSNDYTYLDKMAEIVRIYLDLEVISSVKDNDSFHKLSSMILNTLHIYLDNSEEHILKILLKSTCVTERYSKIYSPIFEKYFSNLRNFDESITNFTYARYLLAFKLWKTIIRDREKKAIITKLALTKLGPSMPKMDSELSKFIPEPPEGHQSGTQWLMQSNLFDFRKTCDDFLSLEKKMHSFSFSEEIEEINLNSSNASGLQLDLEKYFNQKAYPEIDKITKKKPVRKRVFPKLKQGEVITIDLTSDIEVTEQSSTKKQKIKKKPQWLKEVKIHRKFKKPQLLSNRLKLVEVADAHSTESCENFEKSFSKDAYSSVEDNIVSQKCITTPVSLSQTYVTSVCDKLRTSVLNSESRDMFTCESFVIEDISSRSEKELPINWDNRSDITEICPVSTTVLDQISETLSDAWTDNNSADSEAPDAIASGSSEISTISVSTNFWKIPQEEVCDEYNIFSNSLFEGSLGLAGVLNFLLDYNMIGLNFKIIDPNLLKKDLEKNVEISNNFSEDPPLSFENEERIEMNDKLEKMEDSPTLIKCDVEYNEEPAEAIEKSNKRKEQMKEEILSSSLKISKDSVVCRSLTEKESSNEGKKSKKSSSLSEDPPLSFENEERIEMNDKFEKMEDSPTLINCDIEYNEEPAEAIEKSIKRIEQMNEEILSSSLKISKDSVVCRSLPEKECSNEGKESKKSSNLLVHLPFKKRFYANEEENLNVVNKDV